MKDIVVCCLILIGAIVLLGALFLLASWIIWVVWNALAVYFGFKAITFGIAMLVCLALNIIGNAFKNSDSK